MFDMQKCSNLLCFVSSELFFCIHCFVVVLVFFSSSITILKISLPFGRCEVFVKVLATLYPNYSALLLLL